jgi:DHA2 family multidrug resistance protein
MAAVLAPNLGFLVAFRVLQGLGGGAMSPVGLAIIYELFPPDRRGSALSVWGIAVMAAPAVGPVLGGWLVTAASWRLLFLINVPIGLVGLFLARRVLHDVVPRTHRVLDWQGLLLAAGGLGILLLGLSEAPSWTWGAPRTVACLVVSVILLLGWVVRALRVDHPLVEMRMFASPTFSLCIIVLLLLTMAQYGRLVFIPLELENLRHFSALHVGVMLVPTAVCAASTMIVGGRLADRIGPRVPTALGVALIGLSTWGVASLDLQTSDVRIACYLAAGGLGMGLSMMPTTVAALLSLPNRMAAEASSLRTLSRQVSGSLGVALLSTIVAARLSGIPRPPTAPEDLATGQSAYNLVFTIAAVACVASFVVALFLPGKRKTKELQRLRADEHLDVEFAFAE